MKRIATKCALLGIGFATVLVAHGAEEPAAAAQRQDVLGFARHIPADAEALMTFHDGAGVVERVKTSQFWKLLGGVGGEFLPFFDDFDDDDEFEDLDGILEDEGEPIPGAMLTPGQVFGREVTIALGKSSGERIASYLDFNRRSSYFQMRKLGELLFAKRNVDVDPEDFMGQLFGLIDPESLGELLQDDVAGKALDTFSFPPLIFAVRVDAAQVDAARQLLAEPVNMFAALEGMIAPVEAVQAGSTFTGYRLIGAEVAKEFAQDRESMDEFLGRDAANRLLDFLEKRELVAMSGTVGEYAVLFFGGAVDEFRLAATPEESLAQSDALAFADAVLDHPFYGLTYGEKSMLEAMSNSVTRMADLADGLHGGITAADLDGRNRDLAAMLRITAQRERALRALTRHAASGITLVDDGGPRLDMRGGATGMLDFSAPLTMASLEEIPGTAVFFNMALDRRYQKLSSDYQEALFETIYAMMMRFAEPKENGEDEDDDFSMFPMEMVRAQLGMFDGLFREELVKLWRATNHDMRDALGAETAMIVDFQGALPAMPGVPKALVGQVKSPRAALLSPVADRAKLATAWEAMQASGDTLATRIGEMREAEVPMPKPIRSESDGFTSWFLPLPFFDDEFLPSVTLNDAWFALGSSRNQSLDVLKQLENPQARPGGGMRLLVDFEVIADYYRAQLAVMEEQKETLIEDGDLTADDIDSMATLLKALELLQRLEAGCWEEGGVAHTRIHLRVRP